MLKHRLGGSVRRSLVGDDGWNAATAVCIYILIKGRVLFCRFASRRSATLEITFGLTIFLKY